LEVGPGTGNLTSFILKNEPKEMLVIEKDDELANNLDKIFNERITIINDDILNINETSLFKEKRGVTVFGNLPYNISTAVLFHLVKYHEKIEDMSFMLQLEVVERMSASVGDKDYGRLSLMLQYFCQAQKLFDVSPQAFTPQPKVNSAIVRLTPHKALPITVKDTDCLKVVVRTAFNQRRKTLKNSLKTLISDSELSDLEIDMTLRPEKLTLTDYVKISDAISESTN